MGVVRQGVEEEVRQPVPGQVFRQGPLGGKDQPVRIEAPAGRLGSEVGLDDRIAAEQPQDRARDAGEEIGPDVEDGRRDLVAGIEAAEDEAALGQPRLRPGRRLGRDLPAVVIRLVGEGKPDDLLVVIHGFYVRNDNRIRQDIVGGEGSHGPRIAEVVDLQGRAPAHEDPGPAEGREAVEVHGDVHAGLPHVRDNDLVAPGGDIREPVAGRRHPATHVIVRVRRQGVAMDLEARTVMRLQEPRQELGDRVRAEVRRDVGDADPVMDLGLAPPVRRGKFREADLHVRADAGHLVRRIIIVRKESKGDGDGLAAPHPLAHLGLEGREVPPVAAAHLLVQEGTGEVWKGRIQAPRGAIGLDGLGMSLQGRQEMAAVGVAEGVARVRCQGEIQGLQGLAVPPEAAQGVGPEIVGVRRARVLGGRAAGIVQGPRVIAKRSKGPAQGEQGLDPARFALHETGPEGDRLSHPTQAALRHPEIVGRMAMARDDLECLPVAGNGGLYAPGPVMGDSLAEEALDVPLRHAPAGAARAASTAETISGACGSVRGPKAAISCPSRPTRSLWKFQDGSAASPRVSSSHL